jgi:branched-chain amino acid transport system permease protein
MDARAELVLQAIVAGLMLGGVYGLIALGLNLIYGVMDVINFAHGASMMIAMYMTFWLWKLFSIDPYVAIFVVVPAMFVFGYFVQRVLLESLIGTAPSNQFLTTLGLATVLQYSAQMLWTANFRAVQTAYTSLTLRLGPVSMPAARLTALGFSIVLAAILFVLLKRTPLGRAIQAAAQDLRGAAVCGINIRHIYAVTFGFGLAAVGAAGAIVLPFFWVAPTVGDTFNVPAFLVVVLGGLGSMPGAIVGGLIIGLVTSVGSALLPGSVNMVAQFATFIGILLFKPSGLLGRRFL